MNPITAILAAPAAGAERAPSVRGVLAALSLSMLLSSLGTSIANVGLPTLAQAFHASFQQVQWVVLAYLLAVTGVIVGAGRLGDRTGRRRLLLAGILLFTLASAACAAAPSLGLLVAARAAQGLGAAVMLALALAFVGETLPKAKTGSAMGLLGTMSAVGTALGPTLGGLLIAGFGWRAIFLATVPLGLLAWALAWRWLPVDRPTAASAAAPSILSMLRNPALAAGLAMSSLATSVVMATLVVGPFYLAGALALDVAAIGLVMSCGPLVAALAGVPSGRLVDRFGANPMIAAGLALMVAGSAMLAMLPAVLVVPGYAAPLAVITAGYALFQAANNTAVMGSAGPAQRGVVSGMLNLSRHLGLIVGTSFMGAVFAHGSAAASRLLTLRAEAVASGMHLTFAVAAMLVVVALLVATATRRGAAIARTMP